MKTFEFIITSHCQTKGYFDYTFEKRRIQEQGETLDDALTNLTETLKDDYYYIVTKNALKHKEPIYLDTKDGIKQVGYLIKAHSEALNDDKMKWVKIVSNLWISINEIVEAF